MALAHSTIPAILPTVTASAGTVTAITGVPTGTTLTVTAKKAGCADKVVTIDGSLINCNPTCPKPSFAVTSAPVCSNDNSTYSVSIQITGKLGTVKASAGTLSGSNPYTISGVPNGVNLKITDSLSAVCKYDTTITGINCNCTPRTPVLLTPSITACAGDTSRP